MLISWKKNFLFLHVPKTGGTTVQRTLARHARFVDQVAYIGGGTPILRRILTMRYGREGFIENATGIGAHEGISSAIKTFGHERIERLYKACFFRNPFTRTFSLFSHLKRHTDHANHHEIADFEFHEAIPLMCERGWTKQSYYLQQIHDVGMKLDFRGAFERLEEDFLILANELNISTPRGLKILNAAPIQKLDLRAQYGDALSLFIEKNAIEFETLGYSTNIENANDAPIIR